MKKLLSALLAILVVTSSATVSVFAVAPEPKESTATLELTAGNLGIDHDGDNYPGIEGQNMNFGSREISGETEVYPTYDDKKVGITITDARGDTKASWKVDVKVSAFNNGTDSTLAGATVKLEGNSGAVIGPAGGSGIPLVHTVELRDGEIKTIFESDRDNGSPGKWGVNWTPTLTIIGGTGTVAHHQAVVTWTIGSAL